MTAATLAGGIAANKGLQQRSPRRGRWSNPRRGAVPSGREPGGTVGSVAPAGRPALSTMRTRVTTLAATVDSGPGRW